MFSDVTIKRRDKSKVEMFFFPDEENMTFSPDTSQTFTDSQSSDDDAEKNGFFIVEQEVGIGYLVNFLVFSVIWSIKEGIKILTKWNLRYC